MTQVTTPINKAEIARSIYNEQEAKAKAECRHMIRKDVIALIMQAANLSNAGAQTYYQTIRKKKAAGRAS